MADSRIGQLPEAAAVAATDLFELETAAVASFYVTAAKLKNYMDSLSNQSVTDQAVAAATNAYLVGSNLAIPAGLLQIGSTFEWNIAFAKTAAGTAANVWKIHLGTAGTTADTAICTFTSGVGTAVADTGFLRIIAICRGPLSASGIIQGSLVLDHNLSATGHIIIPAFCAQVASAAFDVTQAGLIIGVSVTTAASTAHTYQSVFAKGMRA